MVNAMVERATSNMLIGPDWAMNLEICDMLNRDPGQVRDVVKGLKNRIGSRNPKVQILALTLLETIIKNCGDIVHMTVAEKDVLHKMVRIVKKKPDVNVKEKILVLVDTWQEAFSGPRAKYPQYYAAYQELLRAGAVFPQRSERSAPLFTPPQTQPLSSYPAHLPNPEFHQDSAQSSTEPDFPTLSFSEIQNARGIMDVLSEMLNALDPSNKEGHTQEVVIDLVEQCRTYKQRVLHLVNSTSDESLLSQGLALNDDLQRVLAKHEAIASGSSVQTEKAKTEPSNTLVDVDGPLIHTEDHTQQSNGSGAGLFDQLALPAPPTVSNPTPPSAANSKIDLLSGDDFASPKADMSLSLVLVGDPQSATPMANEQKALVLVDVFQESNNIQSAISSSVPPTNPLTPPIQQQAKFPLPEIGFQSNGVVPITGYSHYEQQPQYTQGAGSAWNGQPTLPQPQQPSSSAYDAQTTVALPPAPWETQPQDSIPAAGNPFSPPINHGAYPQLPQNNEGIGMYSQPITSGHPSTVPNNPSYGLGFGFQHQQASMHLPQPQQAYGVGHEHGYGYGYGYGHQQQGSPYLEQQMYGMSIRDNNGMGNSATHHQVPSSSSASSYLPPMKPMNRNKPEDKLFGDLVDMSRFKSAKPSM